MIRVTIEIEGFKCTVENEAGSAQLNEFFEDMIIPALKGVGYHEDNIRELFCD